ncbi:MAG: hypothetical protein RMJ84_06455 [Sandaracinaceae bacterium]|nr:hypothetical protein [Sandaracinaceae bacterium]
MAKRAIGLLLVSFHLFGFGCGGSTAISNPAHDAIPPKPNSYLPEQAAFFLAIDFQGLRATRLAAPLDELLRTSPMWKRLAGELPFKPIQELDTLAVAGESPYGPRYWLVAYHQKGDTLPRVPLENLAHATNRTLEWSDLGGIQSTTLPMDWEVAHTLLITAPDEFLIVPKEESASIAEHARAVASHRARTSAFRDPALDLLRDKILTLRMEGGWPERPGWPPSPESYTLTIVRLPSSHTMFGFSIDARFATEAKAQAAAHQIAATLKSHADDFLIRSAGLDRVLRNLEIKASGSALEIHGDLSEEEALRLIGAFQLLQSFGGS